MKAEEEKLYVKTQVHELTAADLHAKAKTADYDLLGFQAGKDDDDFEARRGRGGRGGRGRGDRGTQGGDRGGRGGQRQGGRKGGKLIVDDNEFPAL
jgi:hypothetical protein